MTATTHQLVAILAAVWLFLLFPLPLSIGLTILALIAVMLGALTPDIDQPTANLWRKMLGARAVGNIFQVFSGGHRHFTHSLIGIVVVGYMVQFLIHIIVRTDILPQALFLWTAYMVGYISHPIADSLTDHGVPWFWPLRVHIKVPPGPEELRVTTGSFVETFIVRPALVIVIFVLVSSHWQTLQHLIVTP